MKNELVLKELSTAELKERLENERSNDSCSLSPGES